MDVILVTYSRLLQNYTIKFLEIKNKCNRIIQMKKLILFFVIFLASCCTTRNFTGNQTYEQLDSILKAEHVLTYDSVPF